MSGDVQTGYMNRAAYRLLMTDVDCETVYRIGMLAVMLLESLYMHCSNRTVLHLGQNFSL